MDKQSIIELNQLGLADLHIHSCLSPCADLYMSPRFIAKNAVERGLKMAALTDHNSSQNCPAFKYECEKVGIVPLFGMELNTKEEIHVLCITDQLERALAFDKIVSEKISKFENDPLVFGDQPVVNEKEEILYQIPYYLGNAVNISIDHIWDYLDPNHWLIIPSHINRQRNSLITNLGFIPDLPFDAVEVAKANDDGRKMWGNYIVVRNSDMHRLDF
ncbi:MAG: PHP domain-containing protein [Candidatus Margulisbacteria bacterium]|nr:PHP domain-containing protein [Candidatus Margulisiibacteriota bacterium]